MKLKTLVLIGSLIAFSSCEKEDSEDIIIVNVNELSLDSRLFGNWDLKPVYPPDANWELAFSSDGRYASAGGQNINSYYAGDYFTSPNSAGNKYEGMIWLSDYNPNSVPGWSYYFKSDTLMIRLEVDPDPNDPPSYDLRFIKR